MVLRLFVQPGENKLWVTPRRSEPLPANATPSYSVVTSTLLAAAYTVYAVKHARRAGLAHLSAPVVFVRSSAKAGVMCALAGCAANVYYHHEFTRPVGASFGITDIQWKLWEKTEKYTVDDAFLAGAGAGLALGLVSALVQRRAAPLSLWTRLVGMANIGAFVGISGSNAYFQYTGERQKAVLILQHWRRRRNIDFHHIYWNRFLLTNLSIPMQGYVMLSGIFRANSLPEDLVDYPEKYGIGNVFAPVSSPESVDPTPAQTTEAEAAAPPAYYVPVEDYIKTVKELDVNDMNHHRTDLIASRHRLLQEAEYLGYWLNQERFRSFNDPPNDEDALQDLQTKAHLLRILFIRVNREIAETDRRLYVARMYLQHKAAVEASSRDPSLWHSLDGNSKFPPDACELKFALEESNRLREQFEDEIKAFEEQFRNTHLKESDRKLAERNLEDGMAFLRATDQIFIDLEKASAEWKRNAAATSKLTLRPDGPEVGVSKAPSAESAPFTEPTQGKKEQGTKVKDASLEGNESQLAPKVDDSPDAPEPSSGTKEAPTRETRADKNQG